MEEYLSPDEEYDILHHNEMEAMREMEIEMITEDLNSKPRKSKNSLNFDSLLAGNKDLNSVQNKPEKDNQHKSGENTKKRCLSSESLIDITSNLTVVERPSKKPKRTLENLNSNKEFGTTSAKVPDWPFITVSTEFGDKLYVKINETSLYEDIITLSKKKCSSLLVTPYTTLKAQAEEILKENLTSVALKNQEEEDLLEKSNLWVEKYKPKTYYDLLSDEAVNRTLLNWLKMWDKVVFNREPKLKNSSENDKMNLYKTLDNDGRPYYKIVLLCGPPGLGKTTLAHVTAAMAGYNTIEINASDDRTIDVLNSKLDAAVQMKSVLGSGKPNCLILDEIDGAPGPTVDFLMKYLNGKVSEKQKKGKKEKLKGAVKRPVICICNELYTPSLRELRQKAFVIHFPHTSSSKLAQRLSEICKKQDIQTDISALSLLCDKTQNDIRSCISTLHFFKTKNKRRFKTTDVIKSAIGQKDVQKAMFNIWKEIFHISIKKGSLFINTVNRVKEEEVSTHINYSKRGMDKLHNLVHMLHSSSGDYERLLQGVYENFLKSKFTGTSESLAQGLEWFTWFDLLHTNVRKNQTFVLMPYLPYSFAAFHLLFSSNTFWKITYPSIGYENYVKETRRNQILSDVLGGLSASLRPYSQRENVLLDVLPMFNVILFPQLRPVNPTLFNEKEKKDFKQLLDVMIDYNLNFVQQRAPNGTYSYNFDPNIEELVRFNVENQISGRSFSYNMKQLISHEVELERLRRAEENRSEIIKESCGQNIPEVEPKKAEPPKPQPSKPKEVKENEYQYKDFFGRVVKVKGVSPKDKTAADKNNPAKSPIWFSFKEGYNNAVKKDVTITDIA